MENNNTTNLSNLPEEGAQPVNDRNINNETTQPEKLVPEVLAEEQVQENSDQDEIVADKNQETEPESDKETPLKSNKEMIKPVFEKEDFSNLDRTTLLTKLNTLINNFDVEVIKEAVEEIKTNFYKQYKTEVAEAHKEFVDNGGNPEDFKFKDETSEDTFKVLYGQYKERRSVVNEKLEKEKDVNLKLKFQIIDEINVLINNEESINKTFQEFRDLQQRWRDAGLVPQGQVKNLWENYNHAVERFYDYIKINKELRDLDLKKNLELKIELCEKAEALILEKSLTRAFKTLQEYHIQWREIGPVPHEQKEDIWERFKNSTTQINKNHQDYFEGLKDQQVKNLEQKVALCEKVEEIVAKEVEKPKDWEDRAHEIVEIQKLWRTIGFAPKKDNNKIYNRFKAACDGFFAIKREFYKDAKDIQKNNLQLKLDLCIQAEAMKDSNEWKKTTEDYINLQKKWKEIGPVPRKHADVLWKRFRTACDLYFTKKSEFFSTIDSRHEENLTLKLNLIEKVKNFAKKETDQESLNELMQIQKQWAEIGHVPLNKKDEVQREFREAINEQFKKLKVDIDERHKMTFKSKVDNWVNHNSKGKIYSERNKLVTKIKELENEIALYENNIGFFSASSNASSLLEDIHRKIENAKERMEGLKQKLIMLDSAEDNQ